MCIKALVEKLTYLIDYLFQISKKLNIQVENDTVFLSIIIILKDRFRLEMHIYRRFIHHWRLEAIFAY